MLGIDTTARDTAARDNTITIRTEIRPGDIGSIVWLHGTIYGREQGWDHTFEAYVAVPLAKFALEQRNRERIWIVERGGEVMGSVAIVQAAPDVAQLRWLLLDPQLRGLGIGRALMESAIDFSRRQGYRGITLWTVSTLTEAAELYRHYGFRLAEERPSQVWGATVTEQRYDLLLVQ